MIGAWVGLSALLFGFTIQIWAEIAVAVLGVVIGAIQAIKTIFQKYKKENNKDVTDDVTKEVTDDVTKE